MVEKMLPPSGTSSSVRAASPQEHFVSLRTGRCTNRECAELSEPQSQSLVAPMYLRYSSEVSEEQALGDSD